MRFSLIAATAGLLLLAATTATNAEGFAVSDLGLVANKAECVRKAEAAFQRYEQEHGAGYRETNDWVIYQYDIGPQGSDAFIACIDVGERSLAFLNVFSAREATGEERDAVAEYFRLAN